MNWKTIALIGAAVAFLLKPVVSRADDGSRFSKGHLAAEVLNVFSTKCVACHGPDVRKPKGRFGYVLDLARVASNPEMVIPSKPEESELWLLVSNNEMPPPDAPSGPLDAAQKEAIRSWISAGASATESSMVEAFALPPAEVEIREETPPAFFPRTLGWIGKFHLLALHFPIALLSAAGLGEFWATWKRIKAPLPAVRFSLCLGAAAAIATAMLGWVYAQGGEGSGTPGLLAIHRWLGTTTELTAVAAALLSELDAQRGARSTCARFLIFIAAMLVALTGHFGGMMAQGEDFLRW
jgi:mono/diheme cytochrome c family protein